MLLAAARRLSSEKTGVECLQARRCLEKPGVKLPAISPFLGTLIGCFSTPAKRCGVQDGHQPILSDNSRVPDPVVVEVTIT
jgi:hypothetical protein